MASGGGRSRCVTCGKERATSKCAGCLQDFCFTHLAEHRQGLSKQLDEIEVDRDTIQQTIIHQNNDLQTHPSIKQINQWEENAIKTIQKVANEARQLTLKQAAKSIEQIQIKLDQLTKQLRQNRQDDDITENDLNKWKNQIAQLTEQLTQPSNIHIEESSIPLIHDLQVDIFREVNVCDIPIDTRWIQNGVTVAGGNGQGNKSNQLYYPCSVQVDNDRKIYIADYNNHRIMEWKDDATSGQVVAGGNGKGNRDNQLNNPSDVILDKENDCLLICDSGNRRIIRWDCRNGTNGETILSNIDCWSLTMDKCGYLYVSDINKHEVRRWNIQKTNGVVVAGGNGQGNRLDQLNNPTFIFVDQDYSIYVSDRNNHRVVKWIKDAKEGIIVAGGQGQGNSMAQLFNPSGVIVDRLGSIYVVDTVNYRVMRWLKEAKEGSVVVGENGQGGEANQFSYPTDLSFDRDNNLYVVDYSNFRVQKFGIE